MFLFLAYYVRAKNQFEKALAVHKETGNRGREAQCYGGLGNVYNQLGKTKWLKNVTRKYQPSKLKLGTEEKRQPWKYSFIS